MDTELAQQIRGLHHGDHTCLIYETANEQRAAVVPFFTEGLARGERCMWIADDRSADEVKSFLHAAGVDVAAELDRGALLIKTKSETYLKSGVFDPQTMIDTLADSVRETTEMGFTGLRGSGEMTWALGDDAGSDRIIEYEALLNDFFPGKPFAAICQYNKARFPAGVVLDVLRTHPLAVLGELVCPNLYFEPSEMVLGRPTDGTRLDWRLEQLRRAREAARALEQAVSARETFFAVASHELKTPLAALQLQLDLLAENLGADMGAPERRRLDGAFEQTRRLDALAERLLAVTELHAHGIDLTRAPFDLADVVAEVVARLAPMAAKARCHVETNLAPVHGEWDRARVAELVTNLLTNAFKYGAGKPVHVTTAREGQTAVLSVGDDGIGIKEADQLRIFGPFERAVSKAHYTGFGVGLWIVQQIAEAHAGSVRVESAPGRGATFSVRLPRHLA